jgi:methionyl-tRNA formyltransferase
MSNTFVIRSFGIQSSFVLRPSSFPLREHSMRIVVMGTGGFAVPMFAALLEAGHQVPALVTRPVPPPTGRKREALHPNPMREFAESRGLPVHAPVTANSQEGRELLASLAPELLAVCDYGEILSPETLAAAPLGGINLHASLLPKYRGAAPINWAILKGEKETGVTVIHMTPKLDAGPILAVARTPIGADETSAELEPRLAKLGIEPVLAAIEQLAAWDRLSPIGTPQDPAQATHARRLRKSDGEVVWTRPAERIRNSVRGLQPWPGVFTHWLRSDGPAVRLILERVAISDVSSRGLSPGQAVLVDSERLIVETGEGCLSLERLQPAGKRPMNAAEFLRGHRVAVGDFFGPAPLRNDE